MLSEEVCEFQAILGTLVRPCLTSKQIAGGVVRVEPCLACKRILVQTLLRDRPLQYLQAMHHTELTHSFLYPSQQCPRLPANIINNKEFLNTLGN